MTGHRPARVAEWSRRRALRLLGLGGAGLAAACGDVPGADDPVAESPAPTRSAVAEGAPTSRFAS